MPLSALSMENALPALVYEAEREGACDGRRGDRVRIEKFTIEWR
jgi:hypothetical protein